MAPQSDFGHQPDESEEFYEFQNPEHLRGLVWPELSENIFVTKQNTNPLQGLGRIMLDCWAWVKLGYESKPAPYKPNTAEKGKSRRWNSEPRRAQVYG